MNESVKKRILSAVPFVILVGIVGYSAFFKKSELSLPNAVATNQINIPSSVTLTNPSSVNTPTPSPIMTPPAAMMPSPQPMIFVYRNGTYNTDIQYRTPGGAAFVGIQLSVTSDSVTDVVITPKAQDGDSLSYQQFFAQEIGSFVVGKKLSDIGQVRVSGASLTSAAFDNAIASIMNRAKR